MYGDNEIRYIVQKYPNDIATTWKNVISKFCDPNIRQHVMTNKCNQISQGRELSTGSTMLPDTLGGA